MHMSDKGLVLRMYKELQLKKKNADNQFFLNGQKILTCTSKKRISKWPISIWKDAWYSYSSGKWILKPPWDTTAYSLEWLKWKSLTIPSVDEFVEN